LKPITDNYFHSDSDFNLTTIYEKICKSEKERINFLQEDIKNIYTTSMENFQEIDTENKEFLQLFSFICTLSFDVYVKKQLIEKLIDLLPEPEKKKK